MSNPELTLTTLARLITIVCILLVVASCVFGQETSQYDRGTPPQHTAGVSSLGSYASADLGTINLSNGSLNFNLPLGSVGGRGFSLPLTLNYSSKVWSASRDSNFADETGNHPVAYAAYADIDNLIDIYSRVAPGWTIGAAPTLTVRGNGVQDNPTTICTGDFKYALTRLTVNLPDKGEIQFRDNATDGAPLAAQLDASLTCTVRDGNRGRHWHSSDGSGTIFISDSDNGIVRGDLAGVLILSDGTRYRFVGPIAVPPGSPPRELWDTVKLLARATSVTDRNGNTVTITYPASNEVRYTDQLGRVTKIQKNVPDPDNPSVMVLLVTIPGYLGQNRYLKVRTAVMNQRYRPGITPMLPVINGDYDPLGWGLSWGTATRLFPLSHGLDARRIDLDTVLSELVLPDSRSIQFFYNEFGEIAEVRMPTGGKVQYDYQYVSALPAGKSLPGEVSTSRFHSDVSDIERAVVARRVYADGASLDASWGYTYANSTAQVTASSASGVVMLNQKHYFLAKGRNLFPGPGVGIPGPDRGVDGTGYNLWSTGVERRTETLSADGTIVLSASEEDFSQRAPINWISTTYASYQTENDNRVNEERKILETGQTARITILYDLINNPIEMSEFDFDNMLKRRTVISYSSANLVNGVNYADDSIRLLRLPLQQSVYDGAGVEQARSITEYDIYTGGDGNHANLLAYGLVSGHDTTNYGAGKTTRGNATRIGSWIKSSNSYLYSYPWYDILGNVVSAKDARGNVATISFADDFGDGSIPGSGTNNPAMPTYALPTFIESPPPNPGEQKHSARSQYDFSTGLLTGFKDRNNIVTQTIYNDLFNRPTLVKSALGVSGVESHTSVHYAPTIAFGITLAKNDVLTAKDQTTVGDATLRSWTVTDGFGRTKEAWSRDPQGDLKVTTNYDALGRASQTSNPLRPSLGESAIFTTTVYDLTGRVTSVATPDNAFLTTSYIGNTVTVTDQSGKQRKSVTDALGRLKEVYEAPNIPTYNYLTSYSYDVLDNLTTVTQGSQTRTFVYDSVKRLKSATNPEICNQGIQCIPIPVTYEYDNNGNLTQKTDGRLIVTTYGYDALNRNTTVNYSDTATNPDLTRIYDTGTNGKGRLRESYAGGDETMGINVEHMKVDAYDVLGRPLGQRQRFKTNSAWSAEYRTQRVYNLAGGVTLQTYPSGRTVTYGYDTAGRTTTFTGNVGDGVTRTYASGITYSSFGGIQQEQLGTQTPLFHKLHYNIRGQMYDVRLSTVPWATDHWNWNRGALVLYFGYPHQQSGPLNNGNVSMMQHYVPAIEQLNVTAYNFTEQRFVYDQLNRLTSVAEYPATQAGYGANSLTQIFDYDRWGNRTINPATTNAPEPQFTASSATNRLGVAAGYTGRMDYDAAGNLVNDTYTSYGRTDGVPTRLYDAENRLTTAKDGNLQVVSSYSYNADGQRTRRNVGSVERWNVYGMDGELLGEYASGAAPFVATKEYGYRNGQLLVTVSSGDPQRLNRFIKNLYYNALARDPSPSEIQQQTSALTNAGTQGQTQLLTAARSLARNIFQSSEYVARGRTDVQYVTDLYNSYLQRGPDQSGLNFWVGEVQAHGRGAGLNAFELSSEFGTLVQKLYGIHQGGDNERVEHFVKTFYYGALRREPTSVELQQQTQRLNNTAAQGESQVIADARAMGLEIFQATNFNSGRNDGEYVTDLYQAFLQRAPDAGGLSFWIGEVQAHGRANAVTAFKLSIEFTNLASTLYREANWLVADHLGTPRMIVNKSGSLAGVKRHDYLPFGEELGLISGRTTVMGYSAVDNVRQKFTSKERDIETNLDYFGARYYSSNQGRFTGIDMAGPDLLNPQTLNKYQYCLNNPVRHIDRQGFYEEDVHRGLTYALAMAAGFNSTSAWVIADSNQHVDDHPSFSPMGMSLWGEAVRIRELHHFTTPERRNDLWNTFEQTGDLRDLGTFFHAQQDSFSHEGYSARTGHAKDGSWPDKTYNRPGRADIMALDTFNRMIEALSSRVAKGREATHYDPIAWEKIMPMVEAFNRARSSKAKQQIVDLIVHNVQQEHAEQERKRRIKENIETLKNLGKRKK